MNSKNSKEQITWYKELKSVQDTLDLAKTHKPTLVARETAGVTHVFVLEFTKYMLDPKLKGQQYYMDALGLLIEGSMKLKPKRKGKVKR